MMDNGPVTGKRYNLAGWRATKAMGAGMEPIRAVLLAADKKLLADSGGRI